MRFWLIILIIVFGSCRSTKSILAPEVTSGKLGIDFVSTEGNADLRGIAYFTSDSNYMNIFGPLGINILKLKTEGDSVKIVDIQNKKIYYSVYRNVSGLLNNIFNGKFSEPEEQLICALYILIKNEVLCTGLAKKNGIHYSFRKGSKKNDIFLNVTNEKVEYKIKVSFYGNFKVSSSSEGWNKYKNFETIFIRLQ